MKDNTVTNWQLAGIVFLSWVLGMTTCDFYTLTDARYDIVRVEATDDE